MYVSVTGATEERNMAAQRKPRRQEVPAPRTEVVEVFKTLGIDRRAERERLLTLGGYQERSDKPVYYAIRVTGNLDTTGCGPGLDDA